MKFKDKIKELFVDVKPEDRKSLKDTFNEVLADDVTTSKFMDVSLANGDLVMIEPDVVVDAAVTTSVEGEIVPVADGEHELADGRVIVTAGGIITEVIEPNGDVTTDEPMAADKPDAVPSPKSVIERTEIEKKFSDLKEATDLKDAETAKLLEAKDTAIEELKVEFANYKVEANDKSDKILEAVEVLLDFNSQAPTEQPKRLSTLKDLKAMKSGLRNSKK